MRRYLSGQAPSVEFIATLCHRLDVNADWLLAGRGPMRASESRAAALRSARPEELLYAMANVVEQMSIRVDRMDVFVQTMETRLRANLSEAIEELKETSHVAGPPDQREPAARQARSRGSSIADALPERPREDAD
ncbi:MAG: hypothetical protein ACTS27_08400 [Phycisphaerales bacterium]